MWKMYDDFLDLVPDDSYTKHCLIGQVWTYVSSTTGSGLAMTAGESLPHISLVGKVKDTPLRKFTEYVKSFELLTATAGMAAINSCINTESYQQTVQQYAFTIEPHTYIFDHFESRMSGKKVAMVGHMPGAEKYREICDLSIIERDPKQGDLLDPACEYVLENQDIVFISATTIANKTLPRLLQLCTNACTVVWGPSAPLTPILFEYGVDVICGNVVNQAEEIGRVVAEGGYSTDCKPYWRTICLANPKTYQL
jgi:uncharacterized protein (DUF4213/DUF364 family)